MNRDEYEAVLRSRIELNGFTLIGVFGGPGPDFVYSVGLTARGWPEVILIGSINPAFVEQILTDLISSWFKAEKVILGDNPDMISFADGSSHALRVMEVNKVEALVNYGAQVLFFYPDQDVRFVQALWPDVNGRFPDEPGFKRPETQPIIGR